MKTSEDILQVLHSITKLSVVDGELDTYFDHSQEAMGVVEFVQGSFTRELLELIERHLMDKE